MELNNDKINLYVENLNNHGFFSAEDAPIDKNICDSIGKEVIEFISKIDKNKSYETDDYVVMDPKHENKGRRWCDKQSIPVINFRGKHRNDWYDTGYCDIFNPHLLFKDVEKLKYHPLLEAISKKLGKTDVSNNTCNIYYTDGITDTRRWHKDGGDLYGFDFLGQPTIIKRRGLVKLFIYLTDVLTHDYGPYCYIKGSHLSPSNIREIEDYEHEKDKQITFLSPKGTIIGSYQHGFHRGFPQIEGKKRVMFVYKIYLD